MGVLGLPAAQLPLCQKAILVPPIKAWQPPCKRWGPTKGSSLTTHSPPPPTNLTTASLTTPRYCHSSGICLSTQVPVIASYSGEELRGGGVRIRSCMNPCRFFSAGVKRNAAVTSSTLAPNTQETGSRCQSGLRWSSESAAFTSPSLHGQPCLGLAV